MTTLHPDHAALSAVLQTEGWMRARPDSPYPLVRGDYFIARCEPQTLYYRSRGVQEEQAQPDTIILRVTPLSNHDATVAILLPVHHDEGLGWILHKGPDFPGQDECLEVSTPQQMRQLEEQRLVRYFTDTHLTELGRFLNLHLDLLSI